MSRSGAAKSEEIANSSGSLRFTPRLCVAPENEDALRECIRSARARGETVRAIGARFIDGAGEIHEWSGERGGPRAGAACIARRLRRVYCSAHAARACVSAAAPRVLRARGGLSRASRCDRGSTSQLRLLLVSASRRCEDPHAQSAGTSGDVDAVRSLHQGGDRLQSRDHRAAAHAQVRRSRVLPAGECGRRLFSGGASAHSPALARARVLARAVSPDCSGRRLGSAPFTSATALRSPFIRTRRCRFRRTSTTTSRSCAITAVGRTEASDIRSRAMRSRRCIRSGAPSMRCGAISIRMGYSCPLISRRCSANQARMREAAQLEADRTQGLGDSGRLDTDREHRSRATPRVATSSPFSIRPRSRRSSSSPSITPIARPRALTD